MAANAGTPVIGTRRHRRQRVMSEINVTPMVDVMLVLLIIFMVSAPLLTVGVPIDLPQSQAKSLDQDKEPLTLSVNDKGKVFLQNDEIGVDDLIVKLKAIAEARGGNEARIYVRGDKNVNYGTVMQVMGRLSAAGFHRGRPGDRIRAGLESKIMQMKTASAISTGLHVAVLAVGDAVVFRQDLRGHAGGIAAGRLDQREGILRTDQGREGRAEAGREAEAAGREEGRGAAEAGRGDQAEDRREARSRAEQGNEGRDAAARSDRRQDQEAGRAEAGSRQGRSRSRCRRRSRRPKPSSSRNSTPTRSRRCSTSAIRRAKRSPAPSSIPTPSLGTASGAAAPTVAVRDRRARGAAVCVVVAAGRRAGREPIADHDPHQVQARRHAGDRPAGDHQRQRPACSTRCATARCARSWSASPTRCCGRITTTPGRKSTSSSTAARCSAIIPVR